MASDLFSRITFDNLSFTRIWFYWKDLSSSICFEWISSRSVFALIFLSSLSKLFSLTAYTFPHFSTCSWCVLSTSLRFTLMLASSSCVILVNSSHLSWSSLMRSSASFVLDYALELFSRPKNMSLIFLIVNARGSWYYFCVQSIKSSSVSNIASGYSESGYYCLYNPISIYFCSIISSCPISYSLSVLVVLYLSNLLIWLYRSFFRFVDASISAFLSSLSMSSCFLCSLKFSYISVFKDSVVWRSWSSLVNSTVFSRQFYR